MSLDKRVLCQVLACSGYPPSSGNLPSEDLLLPSDSGDNADPRGLTTASLRPEDSRTTHKGSMGLRMSRPCSTAIGLPSVPRKKTSQPTWDANCVQCGCGWAGMSAEYAGCYLNAWGVFDSPSRPHPVPRFPGVGGLLPTRTTGKFTAGAGQCGSHAGLFTLRLKGHTRRNSIPQSQRPPFTYSVDIHGLWPPLRTAQI